MDDTNRVPCTYPYNVVFGTIKDALDTNSENASRNSKIASSNIRRWIRNLKKGKILESSDRKDIYFSLFDREYNLPTLPDPELPIEDIISLREQAFEKQQEYNEAVEWMPIEMTSNKPIMIVPVGDPHLDDDGCNWPVLKNDIKVFKQPGVFCVNVGDTINNWSGRLVAQYANQETSHKTAVRLGMWFVDQAKWLVWIRGNHDLWTPEGAIDIKARETAHVADWEAKFRIVFPNGVDIKFDTAHHFKGSSIYNRLHGGLKKAKFSGSLADFYISGHTHEWGVITDEHDDTHKVVTIIKVRGYKYQDEYAIKNGFGEQAYGSAVGIVIDPTKEGAEQKMIFNSIQAGNEYLQYLRAR
jgi:hypothetical protein